MAHARRARAAVWLLCSVLLVATAGSIGLSRCADDEGRSNGIPATLMMSGRLREPGSRTTDLEDELVALGRRYGLDADGSLAPNGREWQVQMLCKDGLVAAASTADHGDLIMSQVLIYGFKDPRDYERFSAELLALLQRDVVVSETRRGEILTRQELARRSNHTGRNFMSQCGPSAVAASAASAV